MTSDHNGAVTSGLGLIDNGVCNITFVAELERDAIKRKPSLPERFQRFQEDGIFDG